MEYIHSPYFIPTYAENWNTGRCEQNGGKLATPYTETESIQARNICRAKTGSGSYHGHYHECWLGFNDYEDESHFANPKGVWMRNAFGFDDNGVPIANHFTSQEKQDRLPWEYLRQSVTNGPGYNYVRINSNYKYHITKGTTPAFPICENTKADDEISLITRHRYGHILDKIEYEYVDGTMMIKNVNDEYYDESDISIDEYLRIEMDEADKKLEDRISYASKDNCIKVFEYKGSINTQRLTGKDRRS